jgi:hypothetical protein
VRSVAITCAPRSAKAAAIARPIPWAAPVTKATRPSCVLVEVFGDSGEAERLFRREAERCSGMIPNTIGA